MEPDISTLHNPDILTLRPQMKFNWLTPIPRCVISQSQKAGMAVGSPQQFDEWEGFGVRFCIDSLTGRVLSSNTPPHPGR